MKRVLKYQCVSFAYKHCHQEPYLQIQEFIVQVYTRMFMLLKCDGDFETKD